MTKPELPPPTAARPARDGRGRRNVDAAQAGKARLRADVALRQRLLVALDKLKAAGVTGVMLERMYFVSRQACSRWRRGRLPNTRVRDSLFRVADALDTPDGALLLATRRRHGEPLSISDLMRLECLASAP